MCARDLPSGRYGRHLLDAGHVLAAAAARRLAQIGQTDGGGAVARAPPIGGGRGQMLEQVWLQRIGAAKVGGQHAEQTPGALRRVGARRSIGGGLLHQLAVDFVAQRQVFVAVLCVW